MLISFSVENFRSFKEEATLSMVAGNGKEMRDSHVFTPELKNGVKSFDLLPSAVIYGPNAGGKSNFFNALNTMETIVRTSNQNDESLDNILPFLLSDKTNKAPATFEVIMVIDGVRYQYGFSATQERIHAEWLFAFPHGKIQTWFERDYNKKTGEDVYDRGNSLKGQKKAWRELTSSKALFLSVAANYKSEQLKPIYDWFKKRLHFINAVGISSYHSRKYCDEHGSKKIINFLKAADFAIEDIKVEKKDFFLKPPPEDMPEHFSDLLTGIKSVADKLKGHKQLVAKTIHKTEEGKFINFDLSMESDGTQRMFALAAPFLYALEKGRVLIIDELNQRLHPHLMQYLIEIFNSPKTNPNNAQLIFTTHAVSLLKKDIFRRDQIWFCERDANQATTLFSLTDFKPRKEHEDFEAYYMGGRYGALPIVGSFSDFAPKEANK